VGPVVAVLVGASAWITAAPIPQHQVRLAASAVETQASCPAGWKLMTIPEVLRMIEPPATADHVRATDVNRDNYLCVALSPNGFRVTRYVDDLREPAAHAAADPSATAATPRPTE
jgi:hypothetical protein